ncbi:geranylgeranyl diphosphate reductase [Stappia stellulata]|uniref:geranylgeranyl diphosphate reductase n=1 Tax=Stappia stellulata TaxID=71235 RepID=UPI000414F50F|nr:geranylgeranyl diphosphate reductase [Stappia stellulata]
MENRDCFDVVVVGGGPAGATAAQALALEGHSVLLIDRDGRIKPCGGAIPTRAIRDFNLPMAQLTAKVHSARIVAPSGHSVAMDIGDLGYVGMVDRDLFDPFLRARAVEAGAVQLTGSFKTLERNRDGTVSVGVAEAGRAGEIRHITARCVIGADGANSAVRRSVFGPKRKPPYVFAYHEIVESPAAPDPDKFRADRCDVVYDGRISPDFYGWVFPHGTHTSIGCGSAVKGHSLKAATRALREDAGLSDARTVREEGAPLPLKPMRRWDDGRNVVLVGDAAGVVAPCSGEGIYYAMLSGQIASEAVGQMFANNSPKALACVRKRFMREHGMVFFTLGIMQSIWYGSDKRREQFVKMCADPDVQRLTWESYLNKKLVRREPMAHLRVALKDIRQLLGITARV